MNHEGLWTLGNKLRVSKGRKVVGGWFSPEMGIKEGKDCKEPWVLYVNDESWSTTSGANEVLYGD